MKLIDTLYKKCILHQNINFLLLYFVFYFIFFLSYFIKGSLLTEGDSIYHIAAFNYYYESLLSFFSENQIGQPLSPVSTPYLNGEPAFGIFPIWFLFRILGFNQLWSFNLLLVTLLSLNAFAVFHLTKTMIKRGWSIVFFLSGIFFSSNSFVFANLDFPNVICLFYGLFAVCFYYHYLWKGETKFFVLFILFALAQMISSMYNFMYIGIFAIVITLFHIKTFIRQFNRNFFPVAFVSLLFFIVLTGYLFLLTGFEKSQGIIYGGGTFEEVKTFSISFSELIKPLPASIYSYFISVDGAWFEYYKTFFTGFILSLFGLLGLYSLRKSNPELVVIFFIALILGLGTYTDKPFGRIILPLGWILDTFDLYGFFRFPYRFFLIVILMFSISSAVYMQLFIKQFNHRYLILFILFLTFIIENNTFSRKHFDSYKIFEEGLALKEKYQSDTFAKYIFLPTPDLFGEEGQNIIRTENIYMFFQTQIRKDIPNGNTAYISEYRKEFNDIMNNSLNYPDSLYSFLESNNISQIIFYAPEWGFAKQNLSYEQVRKVAEGMNISVDYRKVAKNE